MRWECRAATCCTAVAYAVRSAAEAVIGVKHILANNEAWAADRLAQDPHFFSRLSRGQDPSVLYIGCSDSRVAAEEMMGLGPGEAFVLRNIANTASALDVAASSVINYAVSHLEVDDVIVCGHYLCGGIEAAMRPRDLGPLNPWLRTIRDVYRTHAVELDAIEESESRLRRLVELNVEEQCINVLKFAEVQQAYRSRGLRVHGFVFDISRGRLFDIGLDLADTVERISQIYRLS